MKNLIVASTSTIHGSKFLEYLLPELKNHFLNVRELLFIPFARPGGISHDVYTDLVKEALKILPLSVKGIHEFSDPIDAINNAEGIFVGGGNTFVLVDQLLRQRLMEPLQKILSEGTPYLGTSAGSNIVGPNVKTTNDMPIVHPKSLNALGLIPFNLNPHFLDPDPDSTHKGETRETRIKEFHCYNETTVVGLREGSWLAVNNRQILLKGVGNARIFKPGKKAFELPANSDLMQLL